MADIQASPPQTSSSRDSGVAVRIEGGLLGPDTLEALIGGDLPGQAPRDFGLDGRNLTDDIAAAFADARALWGVFQHRFARLSEGDLATSVTRDAWMIPFLGLLGYELSYNPRAYEIDGLTFAISHRAGSADDSPPVHIVGARQELGRMAPSGRPRLSPHALVQEYLNRTEVVWGVVSNGHTLRLVRNSTLVRRQAYVEFDLAAIIEEQRFTDFVILYRLLHRSRLPRGVAYASTCLLEQYYSHSIEQGGRVRDKLRDGVERCITGLANGYLSHPANDGLRWRVAPDCSGAERITAQHLYRELLRLVYRFLFLLVSEDRGLVSSNTVYREHYGIARLRKHVDLRSAYTDHDDLSCSLRVLWKVLRDERLAAFLDTAPLNGELFAQIALDEYTITNRSLLEAFWPLVYYEDTSSRSTRRVNYAALDVEELGSVYESLLEFHPVITTDGRGMPRFDLTLGSERKSTGSYYTPPELVNELVRSALEPVLTERLGGRKTPEEKARAVLGLRVVDPACGSGHFLLAAARRLAKELARVRTGEDEPAPERVREAIREVIAHSIYGVDRNPLAVELCRVALWIEGHCEGKPLTFLDHRIRCGDSLVGILDLGVLTEDIPDEAFDPVGGDDKPVARDLKKRNRAERRGQLGLPFDPAKEVRSLAAESLALSEIPEDTPEQIQEKARAYSGFQHATEQDRIACNLWTGSFFVELTTENLRNNRIPTTDTLRRHLERGRLDGRLIAEAQVLAERQRFFHWPLEFPEVFTQGGFDVVLCNPPWERIKLQEQEFFAAREPEIARAPNKAARQRLIRQLPEQNPVLWRDYSEALRGAEALGKFLRQSGRFPLTARGDINTYAVFAEVFAGLTGQNGRAGVVLPTGIATDDTNKQFFAHLVETGRLASLLDFENREGIFPGVHRSYKFSLLTLRGGSPAHEPAEFLFFATRADHLRDERRRFTLTAEDFRRFNANTLTCPVFRTRADAELTRKIYERVPVLVREGDPAGNPWGISFLRMFDMSNDSHLFRTREQLEGKGFRLVGNRFVKGREVWLPLYEGRLGHQYNHRFATEPNGVHDAVALNQLQAAEYIIETHYFVSQAETLNKLRQRITHCKSGLLGHRRVSRNTDERTVVAAVIPWGAASYGWILSQGPSAERLCMLCANYNSITFDYLLRVGVVHCASIGVIPDRLGDNRLAYSLSLQFRSYGEMVVGDKGIDRLVSGDHCCCVGLYFLSWWQRHFRSWGGKHNVGSSPFGCSTGSSENKK